MITKTVNDRKGKIEQVLVQAQNQGDSQGDAMAWQRLCRELEFMTAPEAKSPRYNNLLRAICAAATNEQS